MYHTRRNAKTLHVFYVELVCPFETLIKICRNPTNEIAKKILYIIQTSCRNERFNLNSSDLKQPWDFSWCLVDWNFCLNFYYPKSAFMPEKGMNSSEFIFSGASYRAGGILFRWVVFVASHFFLEIGVLILSNWIWITTSIYQISRGFVWWSKLQKKSFELLVFRYLVREQFW